MNYDSIIGGIGEIPVDTIKYGGMDMAVGGVSKSENRNKLLQLKYIENDTKKLLSIIGMSRPVIFGEIDYDDGKKKSLNPASNQTDSETALINKLKSRLNMPVADVILLLTTEYKLQEPLKIALTELIGALLKCLKNKRPNMRAIKIDGDIGEILDKVSNGESYFKIATDHKEWPNSLQSIIIELLNELKKEINKNENIDKPLSNPKWPELDKKTKKALTSTIVKKNNTIRDYVESIVIREHNLMDYMDSIESYFIQSAKDIQEYIKILSAPTCKTCNDYNNQSESASEFIVMKKRLPNSFLKNRRIS